MDNQSFHKIQFLKTWMESQTYTPNRPPIQPKIIATPYDSIVNFDISVWSEVRYLPKAHEIIYFHRWMLQERVSRQLGEE